MPVIRFVREGLDVECYPGENLREVALREGIALYGLKGQLGNCGGCGQCITCFVDVVGESSPGSLSGRTAVEEQKLRRRPQSWRLACQTLVQQSVLVLTRQALPMVRSDIEVNRSARGGYILSPAKGKAQAVILATGSEVHLALEAQATLRSQNVEAQVVSLPCTSLFDEQPKQYQEEVIPSHLPAVAIEAAMNYGWERYIGRHGTFIGMNSFGASAPADARLSA